MVKDDTLARLRAELGRLGSAPELETVWADDIVLDVGKPGLIDGLMEVEGVATVYGASGAGKTFVVLDMACHVAAGRPWRGMRVEPGVVVYVAAENPGSIKRRVWAWKRRHGVEHLPVLVVQSSVDLLNGDADKVVALIGQLRERGLKVVMVVIDTLARAMTGNENAPDDMGRFVAACGRIREAAAGFVVIVHHCGKDEAKGARGHSALRAAVDVEAEVTPGALTVRKVRDGDQEGKVYGFRLETVELGTNAAGRVVTTCVAVESDTPEGAAGADRRRLGPNERIALEALEAALCDLGRRPPSARDIPFDVGVVTLAEWRGYIIRYQPDDRPMKRRTEAADRAIRSLVANHTVKCVEGYVWVTPGRMGRTRPHEASRGRAAEPGAGPHGPHGSLDMRPCGLADGPADAAVKVGETRPAPGRKGGDGSQAQPAGRGAAASGPHEPHAAGAASLDAEPGPEDVEAWTLRLRAAADPEARRKLALSWARAVGFGLEPRPSSGGVALVRPSCVRDTPAVVAALRACRDCGVRQPAPSTRAGPGGRP